MALLRVENLHVRFKTPFGALRALRGIDFDLARGDILGLVGETGCGKSVTGRSVMRLLDENAAVTGGRIFFEDADLLRLTEGEMHKIRGNRIAMIFQDPATALNPLFTIGQQIDDVQRTHRAGSTRDRRRARLELMASVGLPDAAQMADVYPHQLSGGQQQRAMIALSLAAEPDVIIADEPTTALDVTIQAQILDLLRRLQRERSISVVLITHDLGIVAETCQKVVVLYAGRVVEKGTVEAIFADPQHPYTRGLLAALPRPGSRGTDLKVIPGNVPSGLEAIDGCAFAPRCEFVMERCQRQLPPLMSLAAEHQAACLLHEAAVHG
ncbi:MAG: ABC transporter ATP-binding protein [Chloroflexi bacterium]|nr:ABC transporter ATP-binding protein [Chloroflexota bacterium]